MVFLIPYKAFLYQGLFRPIHPLRRVLKNTVLYGAKNNQKNGYTKASKTNDAAAHQLHH